MIDHSCGNRHRMSQNLVEQYLLDNLSEEYKRYQIRYGKIQEQMRKQKKAKSPEKLRKELDRLNLLFQKDRIDWEYYNKEYDRIEKELQSLNEVISESCRDFSRLEELLQTDFRSMYLELTPENRRAFWRSTISQIHLNEDYTIKCVDFL